MGIVNCCDAREQKDMDDKFSLTKDTFDNKIEELGGGRNEKLRSKVKANATEHPHSNLPNGKMPIDFNNFTEGNNALVITDDEFNNYINPVIKNVRKDNEDLSFLIDKEKRSPQLNNAEMFSSSPVYFKNRNFIYKGQWKSSTIPKFPYLFHGRGSFLDISNGLLVEGLFNDSKLFYGRVYASDGSFYEGEIQNNQGHGQGRYVDSQGINYISGWNQNVRTRNGTIIFPSGTRYTGKFEKDMLNDESGLVEWNGFKYSGSIRNYLLEGDGCLDTPNGRYEGKFSNNLYNGRGKFSYKSGLILEASFANGMIVKGTFTFPNHQTLQCKFRNGKVNDEAILSNGNNPYLFRFGKMEIKDDVDPVLLKNANFFEYDETFSESFIEKNNLDHFYIDPNEEGKIMSSLETPVVFLQYVFPDMINSLASSFK